VSGSNTSSTVCARSLAPSRARTGRTGVRTPRGVEARRRPVVGARHRPAALRSRRRSSRTPAGGRERSSPQWRGAGDRGVRQCVPCGRRPRVDSGAADRAVGVGVGVGERLDPHTAEVGDRVPPAPADPGRTTPPSDLLTSFPSVLPIPVLAERMNACSRWDALEQRSGRPARCRSGASPLLSCGRRSDAPGGTAQHIHQGLNH
jgi:hypothetical protein